MLLLKHTHNANSSRFGKLTWTVKANASVSVYSVVFYTQIGFLVCLPTFFFFFKLKSVIRQSLSCYNTGVTNVSSCLGFGQSSRNGFPPVSCVSLCACFLFDPLWRLLSTHKQNTCMTEKTAIFIIMFLSFPRHSFIQYLSACHLYLSSDGLNNLVISVRV